MHLEYFYNNDSQEMNRRVPALARDDEPALCAQCQEVSRQAGTSSLDVQKACTEKGEAVRAIYRNMRSILQELSQAVSSGTSIFGGENGQADFSTVCRLVLQIEEQRRHLIACIAELTQARQILFEVVANTNQALHFLRSARLAVSKDVSASYTEAIEHTERAYACLKSSDASVCEVQNFAMTLVERHLSAFMERLRSAADFNHAGAALNRGAIRTLCEELLILIGRAPNITF